MRMLGGVIAAHPFISTLIGDASLSRRPMRRIIGPLTQMGATVTAGRRRSSTRHHSRRRPRRHPLRARHAQRPGEVGGAAGRPPGERRNPGRGTGLYPGSYGTRPWRRSAPRSTVAGRPITLAGGQRLPGRATARARRPLLGGVPRRGRRGAGRIGRDHRRCRPQPDARRAARRASPLRRRRSTPPSTTSGTASRSAVCVIRHGARTADRRDRARRRARSDRRAARARHAGTFGGSVTVSGAGELRVKESDRISGAGRRALRAMGADADERPDGFQVRAARPAHRRHRRCPRRSPAGDGLCHCRARRHRPHASRAPTPWPCPTRLFRGSSTAARVKATRSTWLASWAPARPRWPAPSPSGSTGRPRTSTTCIEREERRDIPTIFRQDGEPYFRARERRRANRACSPNAARSSPSAAAPSPTRPIAN